MAKQAVDQRIAKIIKDVTDGKEVDIRARWKAVLKDGDAVPGLEDLIAACGLIPDATLDDIPRSVAVRYAARDADATQRIAPILAEKHAAMGLEEVEMIDLAILPMVERMQTNGMPVDLPHFKALGDRMLGLMDERVYQIWDMTGYLVNPDSGDQVAALIFGPEIGLKARYETKKKTRGSTDDKTLEGLRTAHPVIPLILDYREFAKIRNSFAVTLPRTVGSDGRIRCTLRVTRVSSGRIAASSPNLMAIPVRTEVGRDVRRGFRASTGHILGSCDLDQIEMRDMADQSGDPTLCGLFQRGEDVHSQTASQVFGIPVSQVDPMRHRYPAKRIGFGVITGITGKGLSEQLALAGIEGYDAEACDEMIEGWFEIYPGVKMFIDDCRAEAKRNGFVKDRWGRIRYLPGIHSPERWMREEAERQSHSFKISASSQGVLKLGMAAVWTDILPEIWREGLYTEPLLQIHDELLFELQEDLGEIVMPMVRDALTSVVKWKVPLKAKYKTGQDWGSLE